MINTYFTSSDGIHLLENLEEYWELSKVNQQNSDNPIYVYLTQLGRFQLRQRRTESSRNTEGLTFTEKLRIKKINTGWIKKNKEKR